MFKKISLALFASCMSVSSYAYMVEANLTVENKTDIPMVLTVQQPNGQSDFNHNLPAHKVTQVYLVNGDHSGLLYQTSTASFKISGAEDQKMYVQGRVVYYVGGSVWHKYSYLNTVSAAEGLAVDPVYTCKNGGYADNTVFENKLIINGVANKELEAKDFPAETNCQGLKYSTLDQTGVNYTPVCYDGESIAYLQRAVYSHYHNGHYQTHYHYSKFSDVTSDFVATFDTSSYEDVDNNTLHAELDKVGGNVFCESW